MPEIDDNCPSCGGSIKRGFGQGVHWGRLDWWTSLSCAHCGLRQEEDDHGLPPPALRDIILAEWGEWELVVPELGNRTVLALKVMRQHLELPLTEVSALRARIPGSVRRGTQPEMIWLQQKLEAAGIVGEVRRLDLGNGAPSIAEDPAFGHAPGTS